ncbi:MAG: hypothetical protein M3680_31560, partial [Myxococcota bacterium]|nr:hypothetical protein [Myxococcota bacterium]
MVNGPTCGVCGWALRWLAPQSGWGCDRCQRMFPASVPTQPYGYGPPMPSAPPSQVTAAGPGARGGSRTGLVIGLVAGGVAIAGVIAAVVLLQGGSGGRGGSREDVAIVGNAEAIAKVRAFKERMCACTDLACLDRTAKELTAWGEQVKDQQLSGAETREVTAISEDLGRCMAKLQTAPA